MESKVYSITPVAKPRMTRSDKWKKRPCVVKYFEFANEIKKSGLVIPVSGSKIVFVLPFPGSYPMRKRVKLDGKPHQIRPDLSNLLKALEDAVYKEDSMIWNYNGLKKIWGAEGEIRIAID